MSETREREELETLLMSPGWLRLLTYVRQAWKDDYPQKIKMAIRDATEKNQNVAEAVLRVDAANDEVNAVMSWPKQRVQQLLAQEQRVSTTLPGAYSLTRGGL
jgi:hypothetical protein